jgi:hypothetical protein
VASDSWLMVASFAVYDAAFFLFGEGGFASFFVTGTSKRAVHFLSIYSLHFTLRRYDSCSIMSSPKFVPTSLLSQSSRLEDGLVLIILK